MTLKPPDGVNDPVFGGGGGGGSGNVGGYVSFDLIETVDGWPDRPVGAQSGTWIGWTDPTAFMEEGDRFIAVPAP